MSLHDQAVQRMRFTYSVAAPLKYVSVLDLGRVWERMLRRAGLPLAYTQGFNPHPRTQLGSVLPLGFTSECEIADVFLTEAVPALQVLRAARHHAPPGLLVTAAEQVPLKTPAPQAALASALYRVQFKSSATADELSEALARLLRQEHIARQRIKKGKEVSYDLRPLIHKLERVPPSASDRHIIMMLLAHSSKGSGRPDEVLAALDLDIAEASIHRERLYFT